MRTGRTAHLDRGARRALAASVALIVVLFGQPIGTALVTAVGGSNTPAPYTRLSFDNPGAVGEGLTVGETTSFVVRNGTQTPRTYRWTATIDGVVFRSGSLRIEPGRIGEARLVVSRPGTLRISLDGLPQLLRTQVGGR